MYSGQRDFTPLFQVLRELIDQDAVREDAIRFHYAGHDAPFLLAQAEKYNLQQIVVDHGFISRSESIRLQADSDILLVSNWNYASTGVSALTGEDL